MIRVVIWTLLIFSLSRFAYADQSPEALFLEGVKQYQTKNYSTAEAQFSTAIKSGLRDSNVLSNLALSQAQQSKWGWAAANFRRALLIDPDNKTAQSGLDYVISQISVKELPHQIEALEVLHSNVLSALSIKSIILFTLITLFAFLWSLLSYLGKRRAAIDDGGPKPELGTPLVLQFAFFIFATSILTLKAFDSSQIRATVISAKVSAQVAPGDNQVELFDLYQGLEVIIAQDKDGYYQVTYPGGSSGWIKKESLALHDSFELEKVSK